MITMIYWLIVKYICLAKKYIKAPSGGGSRTLAPSLLSRSIPGKRQKYNMLIWVMIMMIKFVLLLMMMIFITCCHPGNFFDLPQTQTHCSKKSVKCIISYSIIVFPKIISTYFQSTVWWWQRDRSARDRTSWFLGQAAPSRHRTSSPCISWYVSNAYIIRNIFNFMADAACKYHLKKT